LIIQELSLPEIAHEMKRSRQNVKNYYNREFKKEIQKENQNKSINLFDVELEQKSLKSLEEHISFSNILMEDDISCLKSSCFNLE
jgi:predicted DNA-binding protein YlxM (UPF0122 family)